MNALEACRYAERYANRGVRASYDHGPRHWRDVARMGRVICLAEPEADPLVVLLFAAFHDTRRENDHRDPEHGARAVARVYELDRARRLPLENARQANQLTYALEHHDQRTTTTDPTIGACWDADRLTLVRFGMAVRPELISTDAVRDALPTFVRLARQQTREREMNLLEWRAVVDEYGLLDVDAPVSAC